MKRLLFLYIIVFAIYSCKKDEDPKTTYQVENKSSYKFSNILTYYWDGNQMKDTVWFTSLNSGQLTKKVETIRDEIKVSFMASSHAWLVASSYKITEKTNNLLTIDDETVVIKILKSPQGNELIYGEQKKVKDFK